MIGQIYLSVIIPAYNEEKRLPKTLEEINRYLSKQNYISEILVVDNCSTDRTPEIVKELELKINGLKYIEGSANQGKGFAVKKGMLEAKGDFRVFTDADNSTSIDHIEKAWPLFAKGCEIVIGTRDSKDAEGAKQAISQTFIKRFLGNAGNLLIQIFAVPGIWDTQCGFKVFTGKIAKEIFPKSRIEKWGFDIEILFIARIMGYKKKIGIMPVNWINDAESKVGIKGYLQTLKELFQIRINHLKGYYKK